MAHLRIAIAGATGRMGQALLRTAAAQGLTITGATVRTSAPDLGVFATPDPAKASAGADVWIDFTSPAATLSALAVIGAPAAIIGTTGFDAAGEAALAREAARRPLVRSGNFSLGVNVLAALVRRAAERLGPDWDIEIRDAHHRRKADAPSGTALLLGEAAAAGRGAALADLRLAPHDGLTGPRPDGKIGFSAQRAGGIVGEHDVLFATEDEMIRFSHVALDRTLFARGALAAAHWVVGKPPGLYSMQDVLGL